MKKEKISHNDISPTETAVHIALNGKYQGYIEIADEIKTTAANIVGKLKTLGVRKVVMLTGDNINAAQKIGNQLEIDKVYADLLPGEKVKILDELNKNKPPKKKLVFVGDGINDAPVLAYADIGVSMGAFGSQAAIEASDVVLMTDEPGKLPEAIKIAKKTQRIVRQNIALALVVKATVLVLGSFAIATMWEAVFADVGVSILAVLNSIRIIKSK